MLINNLIDVFLNEATKRQGRERVKRHKTDINENKLLVKDCL